MKLQQAKTDCGVSKVGGREIGKESIRSMELEMELWTDMEMAWVGDG